MQVTFCFMGYTVYSIFIITFRAPVLKTPVILVNSVSVLFKPVNFSMAYTDFSTIQGMPQVWKSIKPSYGPFTVHFFLGVFHNRDSFWLQILSICRWPYRCLLLLCTEKGLYQQFIKIVFSALNILFAGCRHLNHNIQKILSES